MLHWLAGQKQADGPNDPDATGYVEPPETPAPVFAVRAFKHAIFGTPQTAQTRPRRHSNAENGRPGVTETKPSRPGIARPKSSSDAPTMAKQEVYLEVEPLSSPTKGILLSPGTAAARKKNVTFGVNVVDNEEKRPLRSGLGEGSPAKNPEDWLPASDSAQKRDESPGKSRGRTKLADALEQARDESKKGKSKAAKRGKTADGEDLPSKEFASPKSESGKYWKREYDIYRTNTQHEVKKLITKQKAAKSFAQMKDEECTELANELRQEQKKAEKLEAQAAELTSLVEDLQNQLRASKEAETSHRNEIAKLKGSSRGQVSQPSILVPEPLFDHDRSKNGVGAIEETLSKKTAKPDALSRRSPRLDDFKARHHNVATAANEPVQRPSEPYNASAVSRDEKSERRRSGIAHISADAVKAKSTGGDDIWAQSFGSSSAVASRAAEKLPKVQTEQHGLSETSPNPLQNRDLNTLPSNSKTKQGSLKAHQPPVLHSETPSTKTAESGHGHRPDSFEANPFVSAKVSRLLSDAKESQLAGASSNMGAATDGDAVDSQQPSWLHTDTTARKQRSMASISNTQPPSKANSAPNTKENVPPDTPAHSEFKTKPSTTWNSMNASFASKRNVSLTGKDGKEVSLDRIEAARARIAARSRGATGG